MPTILTPEELQKSLDEATRLGFAHFNKLDWLPEWTSARPVLPDNITVPPKPPKKGPTPLNCIFPLAGRIKQLKGKFPDQLKHIEATRDVEKPQEPEKGDKLKKAPHPGADFGHVDSGVFDEDPDPSKDEKEAIRKAIKAVKALEGLARKDGEMNQTIQEALKPLDRANELLSADPKGMQRLKLVFEWTLCHVTTLFGEINAALDPSNPNGMKEYNDARTKYIALLYDLDDSEPETKGEPESGVRGYGRTIKWAYILPLIHGGKIKGAKVIAKWNPHFSSSGIPLPH